MPVEIMTRLAAFIWDDVMQLSYPGDNFRIRKFLERKTRRDYDEKLCHFRSSNGEVSVCTCKVYF